MAEIDEVVRRVLAGDVSWQHYQTLRIGFYSGRSEAIETGELMIKDVSFCY